MQLPGFFIGLAAGLVHFYVLSRFTAMVTGGSFTMRTAALGIVQFLIPMAALLLCALLLRGQLLWAGIGMAGTLITSSTVKLILTGRRKGRDGQND